MIALALFSILAGPAQQQLNIFSAQSGVEMLFGSEEVAGLKTRAVQGEFTPHEALDRMLEGTNIRADWEGDTFVGLSVAHDDDGIFRSNGWDYACVPLLWVAGMVYNRLGLLLLDLGEIPRDTQYCTPQRPSDAGAL